MARQEKDKREYYEKMVNSEKETNSSGKLAALEEKVHEFRQQEVIFLAKIKQLEEELEGKDEEIDNLLTNLDNTEMLEQLVKVNEENQQLMIQVGKTV